jgi:chemotaxis response regulator CheB
MPQDLAPILAIGASSGGPKALAEILSHLPKDLGAAVLVVQHADPEGSRDLIAWLAGLSALPVAAAKAGEAPRPGRVLVAKGGDHLFLSAGYTLEYTADPKDTPYRPSVDVLFASLAKNSPKLGAAVLLTGMGRDGAKGLLALRRVGWTTIAQDQATSEIYGMPKAAAQLHAAELVLPVSAMAAFLATLMSSHV